MALTRRPVTAAPAANTPDEPVQPTISANSTHDLSDVHSISTMAPVSQSDSPCPDVTSAKPYDPMLRASVASRLAIGHLSALVAVITAAHAASKPPATPLRSHACILLMCVLPMRFVLALLAHSVRVPTKRSGKLILAVSLLIW